MVTAEQIRAGRALLRWSAKKLAEESGVSLPTIQRMEAAEGTPGGLAKNLDAIKQALEAAGVHFVDPNGLGPGVRLRGKG